MIESSSLKIEESALTGESVPVEKQEGVIDKTNLAVGDQGNMVFSGTVITYGRGQFVVTATGMDTEIGKIAHMMMETKEEKTPLQEKLHEIGKVLGLLVLGVCVVIFGLGMFQGRDLFDMFFTAVSLAVAAIPEGLPAVVTIVLALGVVRLSKENAVIRKLPAVETLGSSSVICTDKTGTLTQNKMTVVSLYTLDGYKEISQKDMDISTAEKDLITGLVLCNDASVEGDKEIGDPTETALVRLGLDVDLSKESLEGQMPRVSELPFESDRKMMTTIHQVDGGLMAYTKGATDEMLQRCSLIVVGGQVVTLTETHKATILEQNEAMGGKALRVLGLAKRQWSSVPEDLTSATLESQLVFMGLVGMIDPPRDQAKASMTTCKEAGIRPVMITGDHKITATAIASELGILREGDQVMTGSELNQLTQEELNDRVEYVSVYARVSPEHKVKIVKAWQSKNQVVAMTGDGVNDAPALQMAEIGTAMGKVGTDVSRNAADMVLMDDNFATIVSAVREGRGIFQNIRRTIRYLLSCNIGEIILLFFAMVLNMPVPLIPIHILWVNLVTDSFPALALGVEPMDDDIMSRPPRPKGESVFADGLMKKLVLEGAMVGSISLAVFIYAQQFGLVTAQTMTFLTIAFSQLTHSINVRSDQSVLFGKGLLTNKLSLGAIALSASLQAIVVSVPALQGIFKVTSLTGNQWTVVLLASLIPLVVVEGLKFIGSMSKMDN